MPPNAQMSPATATSANAASTQVTAPLPPLGY